MAKRVVRSLLPPSPVVNDVGQFGAFIRALRTEQGLTTAEAAALCGVSVQLLNSLESGKRAVGIDKALHVANELGLSVLCAPASALPAVLRAFQVDARAMLSPLEPNATGKARVPRESGEAFRGEE